MKTHNLQQMYFQCNNGLVHIAGLADQQAYYYCSAFARHVSNCTLSKAKSKVQAGRSYSCSDYFYPPAMRMINWLSNCRIPTGDAAFLHVLSWYNSACYLINIIMLLPEGSHDLTVKKFFLRNSFFTAVWEVWCEELILGLYFLACFTLKFSSAIVAPWMSYSAKLL